MAGAPTAVEIRAFQVGFGDCFLLSFVYGRGSKRHVLIDFGTTELPRGGTQSVKPSEHMPRVAEAIRKACAGKLTAVVATHRHADHISGFATDGRSGGSGKTIAACTPDVVLQPWTEDPDAPKRATHATRDSLRSPKSFVAGLAAMHRVAALAVHLASAPPPTMAAATVRQLRFLGMDNIRNKSAVDNLIGMGRRPGATAVWAHHGSDSGLGRLLPGVKVRVLGPPDLTQSEKIRKMRSSDPDQFWQLVGGPQAMHAMRVAPLAVENGIRHKVPAEARWFIQRLAHLTADQVLQIVRILDDQMNNTSLILLFEVGGKKLLFPGDAQIENWSYALQDAPDAARTRKLIAGVDVYKVGHHGSRNATPRGLLWAEFQKLGKGRNSLQTILSTLPGKHGSRSNDTEVPRTTLLRALQDETRLTNTHTLGFRADSPLCHEVVVRL
jgi:hypothetical protein